MLEDVFLNHGDDIELLTALKHRICRMLDTSNSGRDVAALSRQLMAANAQLRELQNNTVNNDLADIIERNQKYVVRQSRIPYWTTDDSEYPDEYTE